MGAVSVLIKPASGRCDMRCEYCFYYDEMANRETDDFGLMPLETLENIVRSVLAEADTGAAFSFQGGEPTVRGLDFFRELISMERRLNTKGVPITNCLQTNGVRIDEPWARFLGENGFLVGLSLDGPRAVHDRFRRHPDGRGSFAEVMRAARLFERCGVEYNILFTVTAETARAPGKVYSFFKENGFKYLQFMPCIDPLAAKRGKSGFSLLPEDFAVFLRRFFDRWAEDVLAGDGMSVRYFDNLISIAAGLPPEACSLRGRCSCQFVFEADGSCYPCDFYVSEDWRMGNINESTLRGLYESENARRFLETGASLPRDCLVCRWKTVCRGGCRRDREGGRSYYCRAYRSFLDYAWPRIMQVSAHVARQSAAAERK